VPAALSSVVEAAAGEGRSTVLVARDTEVIGAVTLSDVMKPDAVEAVAALHDLGLESVLLTGDSPAAAERVAESLGVSQVRAGVLPTQKVAALEDLQAEGHRVAMVGDGINDAPALAAADLGLGVVTGTDIALKSADIILVRDDLYAIADAIVLARATNRTIRTNLVWAFAYNIAAIPLAAIGLLNPLIAAAAMSLSSVFVVPSSLRLQIVRTLRPSARSARSPRCAGRPVPRPDRPAAGASAYPQSRERRARAPRRTRHARRPPPGHPAAATRSS